MPSKGKKRCGWILPGGRGRCQTLVNDAKHTYCEVHREAEMKRFRGNANRYSGGLYSTKGWKRLRRAHLAAEPLCQYCGRPGQVVDHIEAHRGCEDLFYDSENLMTLCKKHHDEATHIEIKLRNRGYTGYQIAQYKKSWIQKNGAPGYKPTART